MGLSFRNEPPSPVADKFLAPLNFRLYRRVPNTYQLNMGENLSLRGTLEGHNGWVTQIATNPKYPDMILSSSRDKSLIVWKLTKLPKWFGERPGTDTLSLTSSSPATVTSPFPALGITPSASGIWAPAHPPVGSSPTPRRSSRWPSQPTIGRLCPAPGTRPSSCGTPLPCASTPSRRKPTTTGSPASGSPPTTRTPSSSHADGTRWSRSGPCRTAS